MVRFSRVRLAAVLMCPPSVIRCCTLMRHNGGNTLKSQDHHEGLRALPLKAMECEIFHVDRMTIYHWLNAWESRRLCGLYERKGRGRPPKLTSEHKEQIRQWAKDFPRNLHQIRLLIHEKFGIDVSKDTIKNVLK